MDNIITLDTIFKLTNLHLYLSQNDINKLRLTSKTLYNVVRYSSVCKCATFVTSPQPPQYLGLKYLTLHKCNTIFDKLYLPYSLTALTIDDDVSIKNIIHKNLRLLNIENSSVKKIICPSLTHLCITRCVVKVIECPQVQKLYMAGAAVPLPGSSVIGSPLIITRFSISNIKYLPYVDFDLLQYLNLYKCVGLYTVHAPRLKYLSIHSHVTKIYCPELKRLIINTCDILELHCPNLDSIVLRSSTISDIIIPVLKILKIKSSNVKNIICPALINAKVEHSNVKKLESVLLKNLIIINGSISNILCINVVKLYVTKCVNSGIIGNNFPKIKKITIIDSSCIELNCSLLKTLIIYNSSVCSLNCPQLKFLTLCHTLVNYLEFHKLKNAIIKKCDGFKLVSLSLSTILMDKSQNVVLLCPNIKHLTFYKVTINTFYASFVIKGVIENGIFDKLIFKKIKNLEIHDSSINVLKYNEWGTVSLYDTIVKESYISEVL